MSFDTDALAVWINGFLVVALLSCMLAIAAIVLLLVRGRAAGGPVTRTVERLPEITMTRTRATDQAA